MNHHTTESVERLAQRCNENHRLRASIVFPLNDECATTLMDLCAERDALRARLEEAERDFLWIMEQDQVGSGMIRGEGRFAKRARAFLNGGGNG